LNLFRHILIFAIRVYRWTISPAQIFLFGPTAGCRFTPTCSQYAIDAIRSRGAITGTFLAAKRICRCHPFGNCGHDPVSKQKSGVFNLGSTESRPTEI
jgi:putative membrane protein insertion efficiency factor